MSLEKDQPQDFNILGQNEPTAEDLELAFIMLMGYGLMDVAEGETISLEDYLKG